MSTKGILCAGLGMIIAMTISAIFMAKDLEKMATQSPQQPEMQRTADLAPADGLQSIPADEIPPGAQFSDENSGAEPSTEAPTSAHPSTVPQSEEGTGSTPSSTILALTEAERLLESCGGAAGYEDCASSFSPPITVENVSRQSITLLATDEATSISYSLAIRDGRPCRSSTEQPSTCTAW